MIINEIKPNVEMSKELEEKFFSIDDLGMIFDILRNKMYSNPVLAICREYACNARDAHREVSTPDLPIHIHLPNNITPYYKIKDFGPGISPDRMENIFIRYTASTKRNSNVQHGGFGLGSKTGFSYTDSFSITTNVNGVQYHYSCFIDPSKVGKLSLMHEAPTTEPNGTEIQIPVLPKNFTDFATWTEQACRHWDVKPVIKGGTIKWQENKTILDGTNWAITYTNGDWNRAAKMIIDGIEYPLEIDTLRKYADAKLIDSSRGNFILHFGVGELSLSANREQIYLDEKTQGLIRKRLDLVLNEIKQRVVDKIDAFPNLWDANVYYRKELKTAFSSLNFLGKLSWHGTPLHEEYMHADCSVYYFSKGKFGRGKHDPDKISRSTTRNLSFEEGSELYLNDLPLREVHPRHVKKAFDDNPKLSSLQVVCPGDKISMQDLDDKLNLSLMAPKKMSSITKASGRKYTAPSARLILFKFDFGAVGFRQVSYASLEEDDNDKVLCLLSKDAYYNRRHVVLKNKGNITENILKTILNKFKGTSIYGVDYETPQDRLDDDFADMMPIEKFIEKKIIKNSTINFLELKFAIKKSGELDNKSLNHIVEFKSLITNPKSPFLQRLQLHNKIKELGTGEIGLLHIYEAVNGEIPDTELQQFIQDHPEYNLAKTNEANENRYPLVGYIGYYDYRDILPHIAHYINIIDSDLKEKKNVK